ncbi:MAG: hypothetical protein Q8L97_07095 [Nitrosomonas sp.]|uniref:hypothetical protein n=1 Tax=Nitrosomonas sp. TaxID=42353 RepID=UPI00272F86CC|nr:hypothetical protein [Nitrosomonas sp.]MDP1549911.1 hypothetical protein [Nitrosomonas sp.]
MSENLINKLTRQFNRNELKEIVARFIDTLVEDKPDLEINSKQIAEYLVNGQPEGEQRLKVITDFLAAAEVLSDQTSELFGYLLHTLVKNENNNGLISLSVNRRQTVELIDAVKKTIPLIPDYSEEHLEHKNGGRNSGIKDSRSDFVPENGSGDPNAVCRELAVELLTRINDPDFRDPNKIPDNPLEILRGRVITNKFRPIDSLLRSIIIHKEKFPEHALFSPEILNHFVAATDGNLPIYLYGAETSASSEDCLYVHEEHIRGILLGEIIENYHKQNSKKHTATEGFHMKKNTTGDFGNNNSFGDNNTFILGSTLKDAQISNEIYTIKPQNFDQLQQQLMQLQEDARAERTINSQRLSELFNVINEIQTELQKKQSADSGILSKAKTTLEAFKNIASIAGSINAIIALLP